jgi:hypothetical protein
VLVPAAWRHEVGAGWEVVGHGSGPAWSFFVCSKKTNQP